MGPPVAGDQIRAVQQSSLILQLPVPLPLLCLCYGKWLPACRDLPHFFHSGTLLATLVPAAPAVAGATTAVTAATTAAEVATAAPCPGLHLVHQDPAVRMWLMTPGEFDISSLEEGSGY